MIKRAFTLCSANVELPRDKDVPFVRPGGSQVSATPRPCVPQGLFGQRIQPALCDVAFELPVPSRGIEFGEPGAECGQIVVVELADGVLDLLDGVHEVRVLPGVR